MTHSMLDRMNFGTAATSTTLVNRDATLGATLCTSVTLQNSSARTISFSIFDWSCRARAARS